MQQLALQVLDISGAGHSCQNHIPATALADADAGRGLLGVAVQRLDFYRLSHRLNRGSKPDQYLLLDSALLALASTHAQGLQ